MRKGNNNNREYNSKRVESPFYKWAVRIGLGLFLTGGAYLAYKEYKKLTSVPDENADGERSSSTNDSEDKKDIKQQIEFDYFSEHDMIAAIKCELNDESLFSAQDIIILDYEDQGEIDDSNDTFTLVRYLEATGKKDGRINLIIKLVGKLEDTFDDKEMLEKRLSDMVNELKEIDDEFRHIRCGVKSLAFIGEVDGKNVEDLTYRELRKLDSLEGIRYMSIDLYGCESEDGVDFVRRLLKEFHPEGGEEGSVLDFMPIVLATENGSIELPENYVVRNFMKTRK